jgi:signal transduction histidine kinase
MDSRNRIAPTEAVRLSPPPETTTRLRRPGPRTRALIAAAPLAVLAAIEWLAGRTVELPQGLFLTLHSFLELAIAAVALATFAVQWFAGGTRVFMEARARFLAASFLGVGLLELLHLLAFPGMPGFFGPSTVERGIFYWLAARTWTLVALVTVLKLEPESGSRFLRRRWLIPAAVGLVAALAAFEVSLPADRTWFYDPAVGLTLLKKLWEWGLAAGAFAGAWLALRRGRSLPGAGPLGSVAVGLAAMGLAELCFSIYRRPYDLLNMGGHLYLAASFVFLFDSLFVAALLRPYQELEALRAHVEDELVVTIRRLERMREQREDFLRAVSHDLRNPLQVVLLQAERITRAAGDAPALGKPVAAIRFAGRRMERMLRDLTDAARLEVGELQLAREPVDLRSFLDHLLEVEQGVLDSSRVKNLVDPGLPPLDVDPDRLDRILVNLLGNALKYSDGEVRVEAERLPGAVRVTVADRGVGIPPQDLPRLFERYYRGLRHEGEGLGLGLFIVKGLVEAHGGAIEVESVPGEGSTFALRLPVAQGTAPPRAAQQS